MSTESNAAGDRPPEFPVARVKAARQSVGQVFRASRMWWVAVLCLVAAVALTWFAMPSRGRQIRIHFPEGHGLQAGDSVRYRGIDVGRVTSVELNEDLTGVDVAVVLAPDASGLAREGARFWIVRPQLSLTAVEGLETAVGSKYIAVSPADEEGREVFDFDGLAAVPADDMADGQVQVVLRGDLRHSLRSGSPLTWRGVEVGRVLSVHLSADARYVDVVVGIDGEYRRLVRSNSRFWVTSGIDLDVGLNGIRVDAESLDTIARGGVAFITPASREDTEPVPAGFIFRLHEKADPEWLESANDAELVDVQLPPTVAVRILWNTKLLGITRHHERLCTALVVTQDGVLSVIVPQDVISPPAKAIEGSFRILVRSPGVGKELAWDLSKQPRESVGAGILRVSLKGQSPPARAAQASSLRAPPGPEECCAVQTVASDSGVSSIVESLGRHEIRVVDKTWRVDAEHGDLQAWHGAPVVSLADSRIIGVLLATDRGTSVAPLSFSK